MRKHLRLSDTYRFPCFKPKQTITGIFGDPYARVVKLIRQGKKLFAASAGHLAGLFMTGRPKGFATFPAATPASTWNWRYGASSAGGAAR
jgi:hypothetical protein